MGAAPQGPGDDGGGSDVALRQARSNPADFLHRPADQRRLLRIIGRRVFGGAAGLALRGVGGGLGKGSIERRDGRGVPVPAVPGAGLVVIETEFVFSRLEAVLDGPAPSFDTDQRLDRGAGG